MAATAQNTNNTTIRYEKKIKFVEQPARPPDPETDDLDTIDKYYEYVNFEQEVACLMLPRIGVSLILNYLNKDFDQFIQNYNMHSMGKSIVELHDMLKLHEKGIPTKVETPAVLAIREGKIHKDRKNRKGLRVRTRERISLLMLPSPRSHCHLRENIRQSLSAITARRMSERRNRTLLDMVRSMTNLTTLPKSFWGYALESAIRILNMVPTKKVERTPYEIWHGKAPKLSYLRVWGCEALMKRDTLDKLDLRSIKCIFVGYLKETMGYYFYYPLENKIFVAQNSEFFENNLMVQKASGSHRPLESSGSDKEFELIQEEDTQPSGNTSEEHNKVAPIVVKPQNIEVPICRSARIPQAPDRYGFHVDVEEYELRDLNEPPNYKAALLDPESDKWLEAMNTEMQSIKDNQVWILVERPPNDIRAIMILLAIAAFYDYKICQMDVKTAFLNGHLSEDQASRSWNKRFDVEIKKIGFTQNPNEPCVYLKASGSSVAFLILSKRLIALSQSTYLEKTLKKFRMENSKKGYTPMIEKPDYRKSQGAKTPSEVKRMQRVPYALAIGSIIEIHWIAVKTILKYLRNTKDMVLVYGAKPKDKLKVSCYAEAKAEHIATAEASMEAVWMRKFIDGLRNVVSSNKIPMEMLCDNEPAIAIANDPDDNVADSFTKPMPFNKHFEHGMAIGIVLASSLM
ncbi:retrotransposon protein, putative, ty1-copia subclass [Tanacetum coccineum]